MWRETEVNFEICLSWKIWFEFGFFKCLELKIDVMRNNKRVSRFVMLVQSGQKNMAFHHPSWQSNGCATVAWKMFRVSWAAFISSTFQLVHLILINQI